MTQPLWIIQQAGAIAVRDGLVCLVTSSGGKRWVIPKGIIDPGMTAPETALQEAWEEAGIKGTLLPEPVGSYDYEKWGATCHVVVFQMEVTQVLQDWPECQVRKRAWLAPAKALERIDDPGLREVFLAWLPSQGP